MNTWEYKEIRVPLGIKAKTPSGSFGSDSAVRNAAIRAGSAADTEIMRVLQREGAEGWQPEGDTGLLGLLISGKVAWRQTGGFLFTWEFTFDAATIRFRRMVVKTSNSNLPTRGESAQLIPTQRFPSPTPAPPPVLARVNTLGIVITLTLVEGLRDEFLSPDETPEMATFVLDRIDKIRSHTDLDAFLTELIRRWPVMAAVNDPDWIANLRHLNPGGPSEWLDDPVMAAISAISSKTEGGDAADIDLANELINAATGPDGRFDADPRFAGLRVYRDAARARDAIRRRVRESNRDVLQSDFDALVSGGLTDYLAHVGFVDSLAQRRLVSNKGITKQIAMTLLLSMFRQVESGNITCSQSDILSLVSHFGLIDVSAARQVARSTL